MVTLSGNAISDEGESHPPAPVQPGSRTKGSPATSDANSAPVPVCVHTGVAAIAGGLACNSTVLSLDLSDNDISSVGALDLAEALHSDKCKVAQLLLHNNRIGACAGHS